MLILSFSCKKHMHDFPSRAMGGVQGHPSRKLRVDSTAADRSGPLIAIRHCPQIKRAKHSPSCRVQRCGKQPISTQSAGNKRATSPANFLNRRVWPYTGSAPCPVKDRGGPGKSETVKSRRGMRKICRIHNPMKYMMAIPTMAIQQNTWQPAGRL